MEPFSSDTNIDIHTHTQHEEEDDAGIGGGRADIEVRKGVHDEGQEGSEAEEGEDEEQVAFEYNDKGKIVRETWSKNHCKLVYLISRYGRSALTAQDKETWLRVVSIENGCTDASPTY